MPRKLKCLLMIITLLSGFSMTAHAFGESNLFVSMTEENAEPEFPVERNNRPTSDVWKESRYSVVGRALRYLCHHRQPLGDARDHGKEDRTMGEFKLIIDRFEGTWAVVEYEGETFDIPRSLLPVAAKEGDTLTLTLRVDPVDTAERRKRIEDLMDDLFL